MIKDKACVYWCNITNLRYTDDEIQTCNKITGLNNPKYTKEIDLIRHITGLLLAEWAANQFENAPKTTQIIKPIEICYGSNSKPNFVDDCRVKFNISHSGDIVVCAVSDCEVGVDVEFVSNPIRQLMEGICSKQELEWLNQQGNVESHYCLWTYKESFLKCIGEGIKRIRNTISMVENGTLIKKFNNYCFNRLYFREGYEASICTANSMDAYYIEEVDHTCLKRMLMLKKETA